MKPAPEIRDTWRQLGEACLEEEQLERTFPTVMVMAENPVRRPTHILLRGAYDKPGDAVEPGIPSALRPLPAGAPNDRLGFARWVVSPQNPLLARATVNRFWQMYSGTGIVKTVEDFGSQGKWPSHPELFDWLATEFINTGWDVKRMQKLIVTSAAYRQSSKATRELSDRDPENRLLARGPRFRMPAEMIRDQTLFVEALLVDKVGGFSVKPYQPNGLWNHRCVVEQASTLASTLAMTAVLPSCPGDPPARLPAWQAWRLAPPNAGRVLRWRWRRRCTRWRGGGCRRSRRSCSRRRPCLRGPGHCGSNVGRGRRRL